MFQKLTPQNQSGSLSVSLENTGWVLPKSLQVMPVFPSPSDGENNLPLKHAALSAKDTVSFQMEGKGGTPGEAAQW